MTYALVGTALALTGPGRYSLDHADRCERSNRPWMRVLALTSARSAVRGVY